MKKNKLVLKIFALVCAVNGLLLLAWIVVPIVMYRLGASEFAAYLSPIPREMEVFDYTKASSWFPSDPGKNKFEPVNVKFYTISIPRLRIEDATVAIGGENLAESLIQYPGTAYPGKPGNAVIFGHSILPQFYNPKNYISIFSRLPILAKGDEVRVNFDGVAYKYVVEDKFEVRPTDIAVLEQNTSDSFLSLITCTPPGDPFRPMRLIVRARIVPIVGLNQNNNDNLRN